MKLSNLSTFVGAGVLTLSTAILPLTMPASAQTGTAPGSTTTDTTTNTAPGSNTTDTTTNTAPADGTVANRTEDNGFDWGWLGLIGLAGLAGLAGKNRRNEPTAYRDPNTTVGTTGYRE